MGYNGYTNWGTWHLDALFSECGEEFEDELALLLLGCETKVDGDRALRERVVELSDEEQTCRFNAQHFTETLMEEGTSNIDWVQLADSVREAFFERHGLTETEWELVEEWDRDDYLRMSADERASYRADLMSEEG